MRKVLSFVLVLSLVLGSISFAFAAPLSDIAGKDCEEAVNVLTELGVVQGYPDGSFKPEKVVTRAEMAVIVISALGLEDYAVGTANFSDMKGHWANGYVAYAASLGIIAGYPDGTFKPDQIVSYDEAAKMLVAALGYTPDSLVGTWPANYVVKAKALGILDGVKSGTAGAVRGDIATMTYQTLDQKIGATNKDGDWTATDGDTMLDRLGAEMYKPAGGDAGDEFILTNSIADAAATNVKAYLGAKVTAYANSDNEVIAIKEVKSVYLNGKMDGSYFVANDVSYKVSHLDTTFSAVQFLNGVVEDDTYTVTAASIPESVIAADVDGNYIEDVYSVMTWDVDQDAMVSDSDLEDLDDATLLTAKFVTDSSDDIDLTSFDLVGVDSLSKIKEDNVVYVYVGGDYITKVEVGTAVVEGTVSRIQGDKYTIGGKVYELATERPSTFDGASEVSAVLAIDNEVKLYLDVNGDVYSAELIEGDADMIGIVLDQAKGSDVFGSEADSLLKLFLADGTEKTFTVDEDAYTPDEFAAVITDAAINKLVSYNLNSDGQIDLIESYSLSGVKSASPAAVSAKGYIGGYKIASDAVVFTGAEITSTSALTFTVDDEDYSVSTLANIEDATYTAALYNVNSDGVVDLLVIQGAGNSDDAVYGVLTDTFSTTDWDNGVAVYVNGAAKEYNASTTAPSNETVLYKMTFNTDGEAVMSVKSALDSTTNDVTVDNDRATASDVNLALADDVLVYVYEDGDWTVGDLSDIEDTSAIRVSFYETDDDAPGVATIVLVNLDAAL